MPRLKILDFIRFASKDNNLVYTLVLVGLFDLVFKDIAPSETGSHATVCFMCDGRVNWEDGAYVSPLRQSQPAWLRWCQGTGV